MEIGDDILVDGMAMTFQIIAAEESRIVLKSKLWGRFTMERVGNEWDLYDSHGEKVRTLFDEEFRVV